MTSPSSMHETGPSKPVHWDDPEGWDGEGGGRGFGMWTHGHPWLIYVNVWQNQLCFSMKRGRRLRMALLFTCFTEASGEESTCQCRRCKR